MTDLELYKAILRAVTGVPATNVAITDALNNVRKLLQSATPSYEQPVERLQRKGQDRMFRGGVDRGDDAA